MWVTLTVHTVWFLILHATNWPVVTTSWARLLAKNALHLPSISSNNFKQVHPYYTGDGGTEFLRILPLLDICRSSVTHCFPSLYRSYTFFWYVNVHLPPDHQHLPSNLYTEGGFLEYLLSGLAYPEENVKSAVVYILAQLSMKTPQNSLPTSLVHSVCQFISSSLASAKSHNLTLNLLGILHRVCMMSYFLGWYKVF